MMDGFTAQVVLEHHPDPLVVVDRNQHCTFANRAFAEIVAIKAVELIGKSVDVFALAGAEWRIDSQPIMDTQAGLVGTVHYFRRKPISAQARSAYQRGNRPNSLATFSEQEEHLCEAQRLARIGSWCWEPPSGAIWWSEMTHELFGVEPGSVVPSIEIFLAMVHPDDRSLYVDALERVLTGPVEFADDLRIIRRDGKCIWLHSRGRVTRNEAGRPIFVEGTVQDISDRKAAEQTLNTTSNLLQAVASGTTDAMFVKDRAGKYLFFNEAAAKFVGKPVAEVIGKDDFSVFERESARAIRERDERVMLFGVPETKEETLTAAGTTRTYLATKGPYFDQRGEVIGIIGISRDITLRKEAEQALKLTHSVVSILAQADDISDAAPQVLGVIAHAMGWSQGEFWCYVEEMHCLRRTACWPESNQHDPTDLPEHSLASSKPSTENPLENPLPVFVWSRQQALTRQQIAESTFAFPILSEGHVLAVAMFQSASPIQLSDRLQQTFDSIGVQLGVFFKRKQAEQRLRLFRALVDQSNDFIEVIDLKTARILDVNQSSCIAHQYTREELLQLSIPDLDPWVNEKGWEKVTEEFIKNKTKILRTFHRRKDGSLFPVEVNANILRLDRDYMLAVVRDVTNIMRLEEQIAKSQKMEAVGRLAGGVAHDFNNLLTVINCHVDILLMQAGDQDARREHYDAIRHAGHRAAELTAQLLAFSRKSRVEPVYLDLNRVVESAQRLFSRAIREDIRLELCLANDLPLVNANPGQLEQVLMNLVVNAMDAMPGSGSITVTTRQVNVPPHDVNAEFELPEGDYVVLEISDTGHGFDIALKDKIFEPFFTTKEVGKGTGLGLAVVHGVMMQCGGRVEVDSQVGVGSTFHLIFPAVNGANPSMVLSTDNQACHGSETILLVEDEAAVRRIVYDVLKGQGYELLIAQNGAEALSVLDRRGEAVQLVLTDVVMPEMGGVELAKRIQQRYPQTHVLFMSGYMAEPSNDNELSKYGDGFIAKPFSPVDLVRKVRSVLDAAHVAPSGAGA